MKLFATISLAFVLAGQTAAQTANTAQTAKTAQAAQTDTAAPKQKVLQTVTVSGARPLITQTAGKITLNVAGSPIAAGGNAYDALMRIPGLLEQNGNLSFSGKSVNVLIDGRPTHLSGDELKNMLSNMPANGIDRVELLPNPSAKYDAEGGSIIDIRLARDRNLGANGTLTTGLGTGRFAKYNEGLSLNYRTKKVDLYGNYDFVHNEQYYDNNSLRWLTSDASIAEHEYDLRTRNNQAFRLGMDVDLNKRVSFGVLFKGSINARDRSVRDSSIVSEKATLDSSSSVYTHGYARFFDPSFNAYLKIGLDSLGHKELIINADYFSYNKHWDDGYTTHNYNAVGNEDLPDLFQQDHSPGENSIRSLTADYTQSTHSGIKWEGGLKTTFTTTDNNVLWQQGGEGKWATDSGKTDHFIYRENINAAYLTFAKSIKKFDMQLGLRGEQTNTEGESITLGHTDKQQYWNLFPNAAIQYNKAPGQQFGLSYRKSIQRFGFDYVNPFIIYQSQYAYTQGNPDIQPMIMHSIEFTHSYKYILFTRLSYSHIVSPLGPLYRQDSASHAVISSYGNVNSANLYNASLTWVRSLFRGKWISVNTGGAFYSKYNTAASGSAQGNGSTQANGSSEANGKVTGFFSSNNTLALPKKIRAELTLYYFSPIAFGVYRQGALYSANLGLSRAVLQGKGNLALNVTDLFNTQKTKDNVLVQGLDIQYENKAESRFINMVFTYKFGNSRVRASKTRKTGIEEERGRMDAN